MKKILIVEDDKDICRELVSLLRGANYEVLVLDDFRNALSCILEIDPDLVLLDINIPFMNGEMLLQEIRKKSKVPIIMVTSRDTDTDEVLSMSYGADDYITKPYNPNILLLRIAAVLKRVSNYSDILEFRDLSINISSGVIKRENMEIVLTKNEMIIFNCLIRNMGKIVTRDELMTDLWSNDEYINDNALTVNISRLRGKLNDIGCGDAILTRKGIGYILL